MNMFDKLQTDRGTNGPTRSRNFKREKNPEWEWFNSAATHLYARWYISIGIVPELFKNQERYRNWQTRQRKFKALDLVSACASKEQRSVRDHWSRTLFERARSLVERSINKMLLTECHEESLLETHRRLFSLVSFNDCGNGNNWSMEMSRMLWRKWRKPPRMRTFVTPTFVEETPVTWGRYVLANGRSRKTALSLKRYSTRRYHDGKRRTRTLTWTCALSKAECRRSNKSFHFVGSFGRLSLRWERKERCEHVEGIDGLII